MQSYYFFVFWTPAFNIRLLVPKRTEMQVIKLNATDSTNAHIKRMNSEETLPDFTVVQADRQTAGRGQMEARWEAEGGKNLTFSLLKRFGAFPAQRHFTLNATICLSIYKALQGPKYTGIEFEMAERHSVR